VQRLICEAMFDPRLLDGGRILNTLPLRNGRAMFEAFALITLSHGRSRAGMWLLPLDCGTLVGARVLLRRPMLLGSRFRRIAVEVIVGMRGHPEGGETQGRNDECGCCASRHVLRGCARAVAAPSYKDSLGFAAD
jgi:hypothetical protein